MGPDTTTDRDDLLHIAWGIIANAHGGNWDDASEEWHAAAARWRDEYHNTLIEPNVTIAEEVASALLVMLAAAGIAVLIGVGIGWGTTLGGGA